VPDLVTMGKIIGGGTPVGAVAGKYELMNALNPFGQAIEHAGTFTGNPVTMAAGLVSMRLYTSDEVDRLNGLGNAAREELESALSPYGWEMRGEGSLFRFFPRVERAAVKPIQTALWWAAYERGVLLGQNVACALSTPMNHEIVSDVVERLTDAAVATPIAEAS
jgi:glutamate-1-semialdehyde 2,1-aminomutase